MDDLVKSFDKLFLGSPRLGTVDQNNNEKQLVKSVNLLINEDEFEKKYGFRLQDHLEDCEKFIKFLREKAIQIRSCNRGAGKLLNFFIY